MHRAMSGKKRRRAYGDESLTKLLVEYKNPTGRTPNTKFTYHSYYYLDKKGIEYGKTRLRKLAMDRLSAIEYAGIYCNISGNIIEEIIKKGELV